MEEMYQTCLDPTLHAFKQLLDNDLTSDDFVDGDAADSILTTRLERCNALKNSIRSTYRDLKFFKMFFCGLAYEQEQSFEGDWRLCSVWSNMMHKFSEIAEEFRLHFELAPDLEKITRWEPLSHHLRRKIKEYKPVVKELCVLVLDGTMVKYFQLEELFLPYGENTVSLIDLILENLGFLDLKFDLPDYIKQQFCLVEGIFKVFGKFANHISCLACLYWIEEMDEGLISDMERMLLDLTLKYMPYSPGVVPVPLYLDVFKGSIYQNFEAIRRLTVSYVDFIFEHLTMSGIPRERFIILSSYVMDEIKVDSAENRLLLAEILAFISVVQVGKLVVVTPLSSLFNNSPKTNALGFLCALLENLKEMLDRKVDFSPIVKHDLAIVHQQLDLIRPFVQNNLTVLNEEDEFKVLWSRIVDVINYTAYVVKLCPLTSAYVWYGTICLPNVIENIKLVMFEIEKIEGDVRSVVFIGMESSNSSLPRATTSEREGDFVGIEKDAKVLINELLGGGKDLRVISISGMAGQGKTTLAKMIYNDRSVQYGFHLKVWCYVSKECNPTTLLVNIARDTSCEVNPNLDIEDLIVSLWKSLRRKTYLIVLDDIWDVCVWDKVRRAFPNDKKGSRILFTSRNHDLAFQAGISNSISHHLQPFSDEASWALMKGMFSNFDRLPQEFLDLGKWIACLCKGLPLAIVLIGSLLERKGQVLDLWKDVAENMKSHLYKEGCMHIIELSFKYLSEHLKSCFLYVGAFPRGQNISAIEMKLLWIAEGIIDRNGMGSSEDFANKYLDDLVSQNLVVVTKRSSTGDIKTFSVHDLLYDLCLEKVMQDNFLQLADEKIVKVTPNYGFHHRLCINKDGPVTRLKSSSTLVELPTSQVHSLLFDSNYYEYASLSHFLSHFKLLTVLNLRNLGLSMFPRLILCNIHLRYLAIRGHFKDIPRSIVDLWNLETLFVKTSGLVQLPQALWEMESLRYVDIREFCLDDWSSESSLFRPATSNIKILSGIVLDNDLTTVEFLRRISNVKRLKCSCNPMWFSMFESLEELESLQVYHYGSTSYHQLPVINFPNNLKKLSLNRMRLPWNAMSVIGKLPLLEVLKLRKHACIGTIWRLRNEEFLKLKYLSLDHLDVEYIDDTDCEDSPFRCLQKLFLTYCWKLTMIPSSFGDIYSLDIIDVTGSKKVTGSVGRILEQQREAENHDLQVFGLLIHDDNYDDNDCDDFFDDNFMVVGFEQGAEVIINQLVTRASRNLRIISVSGMAGQGKTTLARRIYDHPSVRYSFQKSFWCYVSKECNPRELLLSIAGDSRNIDVNSDIEDLMVHVWKKLKGYRYLIVLDDIWDVDVWRQVGSAFPNDNNGSRILFTSRNNALASKVEHAPISYHLRPFSDDESWELMKRELSSCEDLGEEYIQIGRRISVCCEGLPIAVSLIASRLKRMPQELDLWEKEVENLKSNLDDEGFMHVIELSYKYLPENLKPCFLYFGAFPRGENIYVKNLKLLWMAEGFVTEWQMAKVYLYDLVSQNLVVVTERSSTGGIKSCKVHDLFYDFCIQKIMQEKFLDVAVEGAVYGVQMYDFHHRLCTNESGPLTQHISSYTRNEMRTSGQVRTLLFDSDLDEDNFNHFLCSFKVSTVLDIRRWRLSMFPEVILSLISLRYLALCGNIRAIPESIMNLLNLEMLIVITTGVVHLPDTLWGKERLKYVDIRRFHLGVSSNEPPISMAAASNIEALGEILLRYDGKTEGFLRRLSKLKKLKCRCGDPMTFSMFGSMEKLLSLHVRYDKGDFPSYQLSSTFYCPNNLKKLTLDRLMLPWTAMSPIGKLPHLRVLKLRNMACSGNTWHLSDGEFSKLQYLKLEHLDVKCIDDCDCYDPFPLLQKLFLLNCQRLEEIPSGFGNIVTMDTIDVTDSPNVSVSVRLIVEEQLEFGNDSLQVIGLSRKL